MFYNSSIGYSEARLVVPCFVNSIPNIESSLALCLIMKLLFGFMIMSKDLGKKSKIFQLIRLLR